MPVGRGGGYDIAEEKKQREARIRERESAPAQAQQDARQTPTSIGQLMTSGGGFGREAPVSDPEEMTSRVSRNREFLSNPDTKAALFQFGVSLLGGANIGQALGSAAGLQGRMRSAEAKLQKEALAMEHDERRIQIAERQLGMQEQELAQDSASKKKRKEIIGALKGASDEQLMDAAQEALMEGDEEGARILISMTKSGGSDTIAAETKQYLLDVEQGYKGTVMEWRQDNFKVSIIDTIRTKIATGVPLTPGEQQVYDDSINADLLTKMIMQSPEFQNMIKDQGGGAGGASAAPATPAPSAPLTEGRSGNVPFKIKPPTSDGGGQL